MGRTARNGHEGSLRVAGRYRLVERLGVGGMSEVWRGYDETLGRSVAVKVLSPRLAGDRNFRDRLRQEALAAARLCHPNITGIFDFGDAVLDGQVSVPFVVMELNEGESVSARLARQGPLPWRVAVTAVAEVASALATAHSHGVVHRDVTPANVMLTATGAKVVDFGISAIVGQRDAAPDGSLLGTPAYLAPERLGGAQVTTATDVYALGLLLYRALTGRLPWPAETTAEALRAHLYANPEPLPPIPGLPESVPDLCTRCLSKDPDDRPKAAEVAQALAAEVGVQPMVPASARGPASASPASAGPASARPASASPASAGSASACPASSCSAEDRDPVRAVASPAARLAPARPIRTAAASAVEPAVSACRAEPARDPVGAASADRAAEAVPAGDPVSASAGCETGPVPSAGSGHPPAVGGASAARPAPRFWRGVLAYLGLPGGGQQLRPAFRVLRLRAGLRLGAALRIGGVRPLGGGLFAGGRLTQDVLTGFLRGQHRLQAALVTLALLTVAGLSWGTARDRPETQQAQAAGTGPAAAQPSGVPCAVRYQLKRDSGSDYEAVLTVATTVEATTQQWRLQFSYPGRQRLTGASKAITQKGRRVVAKGSGKRQAFTLRGEYDGNNALPLSFTLDGQQCRAEVLASAALTSSEAAEVSEAAADKKPSGRGEAGGNGSGAGDATGSGKGDGADGRKHPAREDHPSRKRARTAEPTTPPPFTRRENGFSLALRPR